MIDRQTRGFFAIATKPVHKGEKNRDTWHNVTQDTTKRDE